MKPCVVIESHIPHVPDELQEYFNVKRVTPEKITPNIVNDADALIVRTRTRCDSSLLGSSCAEFVATATIGTDHLDLRWLADNNITAVSAPGCNAPAVAQYVYASLLRHPALKGSGLQGKTIAVVGVGHVGSIVARWGHSLGMRVLTVDPPRARKGDDGEWVSLRQAVKEADIVTFHTPLSRSGEDKTLDLCSAELMTQMKPGAIIINAARGKIVDETALIHNVESGHLAAPIIDCWTSEPTPRQRLLDLAAVATPHIAGYSWEGKLRATIVCLNALCDHFHKPRLAFPPLADVEGAGRENPTVDEITASYNPLNDTETLRANPSAFESLRNNYNLRHEI